MVLLLALLQLLQDINMSCCDQTVEATPTVEDQLNFLLNKDQRASHRLSICQQCPELGALNRCGQCGCFMTIKTRIYSAACPLGLW